MRVGISERLVELNTGTEDTLPAQIDYDLHGLIGIRLLNASPHDAAVVARQLGPIEARLARDPDIVVRFVHRLPVSSSLCYLGLPDAGFNEDVFLMVRGEQGRHTRLQMPFELVGDRCEITCESGVSGIPLLIPIVNLAMLAKGILPLHASAFRYNGAGVLVTGWAKGGKTETLLAFMAKGAEYIGDEWVYISGDGQYLYGIPIPIRLWAWHLSAMPEYRTRIGRRDLMRLQAIKQIHSMAQKVPQRANNGSQGGRALNRLMSLLRRQLYVDTTPKQLFNGGVKDLSGKFDQLFFVVSHESSDVKVFPIGPGEVARRMVFSLQFERLDFMAAYLKFRFAFPEKRNDLFERAEEIQRDIITRALSNKEAHVVYHPYPVPISAMFDAISPLVHP